MSIAETMVFVVIIVVLLFTSYVRWLKLNRGG